MRQDEEIGMDIYGKLLSKCLPSKELRACEREEDLFKFGVYCTGTVDLFFLSSGWGEVRYVYEPISILGLGLIQY